MTGCSSDAPSADNLSCPEDWENPKKYVIVAGGQAYGRLRYLIDVLGVTDIVVVSASDLSIEEIPAPRSIEAMKLPTIECHAPITELPYQAWREKGFQKRAKNIPQKRLKLFQWHYQSRKPKTYRPQ